MPGKLVNILLKPSPKILTRRREIKPSKQRIAVQTYFRARPCPFLGVNLLLSFKIWRSSQDLKPGQRCLYRASPLILSPRPPYLWLPNELKEALPWLMSVSVTFTSHWGNSSLTLTYPFPIMSLGSQSRALPRLSSCCFFYPKPFLISLSQVLINIHSKSPRLALAGVAQWIERQPKVTGSIPSHGTCLDCR